MVQGPKGTEVLGRWAVGKWKTFHSHKLRFFDVSYYSTAPHLFSLLTVRMKMSDFQPKSLSVPTITIVDITKQSFQNHIID